MEGEVCARHGIMPLGVCVKRELRLSSLCGAQASHSSLRLLGLRLYNM